MNFLKSMYNIRKLSKSIKKECNKLYEPLVDLTPENIETFNAILYKALQLIKDAEIDDDFKDSFRSSFLGRVFTETKQKLPTLSGNDLWKLFNWSPRLYKDMLDGAIK